MAVWLKLIQYANAVHVARRFERWTISRTKLERARRLGSAESFVLEPGAASKQGMLVGCVLVWGMLWWVIPGVGAVAVGTCAALFAATVLWAAKWR